jgi:hypothetical protein
LNADLRQADKSPQFTKNEIKDTGSNDKKAPSPSQPQVQ